MKKAILSIGALLCAAVFPAAAAYNAAPHAEGGLYQTIEGVPVYGTVRVYDPEGDPLSLTVSQPPRRGSVRVDGCAFVYTPYPGEHGEDTFAVQARDGFGNLSNEAALAVSIGAAQGMPFFCDMDRHPYEYSAIRLADTGVMSGEAVGERRFFYPEREVSRGEFVVQLLAARGWDADLPVCVNTGLTNDADIPLWMKPYIRRAVDRGVITGQSFDAVSVPTRAEAVVMVGRAAQVEDVLHYNLLLSDRGNIPDWAMQSYLNLSAYRMLDLYDGRALPNAALDRGWAAALLWQLVRYNAAQ